MFSFGQQFDVAKAPLSQLAASSTKAPSSRTYLLDILGALLPHIGQVWRQFAIVKAQGHDSNPVTDILCIHLWYREAQVVIDVSSLLSGTLPFPDSSLTRVSKRGKEYPDAHET